MGSGRRALHHATDTGRASSHAGVGKVEEPPAVGLDHGTNVRAGPRVCQASYLLPPVIPFRLAALAGLLVRLVFTPGPAAAQGLPAYAPVNPMADSRTPLGFEPLRAPRPHGWTSDLALDYASAIEHVLGPN